MNKLHDCEILNCFCVDPDALLNSARASLAHLIPLSCYRQNVHDSFIQKTDYSILVGFSVCEYGIQASDVRAVSCGLHRVLRGDRCDGRTLCVF
jgi:hypothetical protein